MFEQKWSKTKPPKGALLNTGHPLAKNLVGAWLMNEGSGTQLLDLANYKKDSCVAANTLWIPGKFGSVLRTDTSTTLNRTNLGNDFRSDFGSSPFTIVVGLTPLRKSVNKDVSAVGRWNTGGTPGSNMWNISLNYTVTSTDYYPAFLIEIGTTVYILSHTPQWTVGQYLFLAGVRNGSYMGLYRNGILINSRTNAGTGAVNSVSARTLKLGEIDGGGGAYNTNAEYHFLYIYKRVLSAAEIAWLYREPFCMLDKARVWGVAAEESSIKTVNGLAKASCKTINGLAIGSVKTWNGLA